MKMDLCYFFCSIYIIIIVIFMDKCVLMNTHKKENNFFITKFYNNKLSKIFHKEDYHFFRLVFIKFLKKVKFLNKYNTLDNVVKILEKIKFGVNQKNDHIYMTIYEELKNISLKQYVDLYEQNKIDTEMEKLTINSMHKKTILSLIPFQENQIFNSNESHKKAHIMLDILYISIIASYQSIDDETKKNMLILLYQNTLNQWMSLNFLRKIMKYKLSLNKDKILLHVLLKRKNDVESTSEEEIKNIEMKLKNILNDFIYKLYPTYLGNGDSAYIINNITKVYIPELKIIGYQTKNEYKLYNFENNKNHNFFSNYLKVNEDKKKIIIQILLSYSQVNENKLQDMYDIYFTIEYVYNILIDYFHYNDNFLSYEDSSFYSSKYIFGDEKNNKLEEEEKKYEDLSLHMFLKINKKVRFTFSSVQKALLKNTKNISYLYNIHFYGACVKYKSTDMIKFIGHFGEGIDNNLINNVIIKMKPNEIIAHIKIYSKKKKKDDLYYVSTKEIKSQLNNSNYFNVLYYLVDSTREIPKPVNCKTCRYQKYHYITLLIAAFVPSLIIFIIFYIIYYFKITKIKSSRNTCLKHFSQMYPRLFYVKTNSNHYIRLSKKYRKKYSSSRNAKSVLKNGFKNNYNTNYNKKFSKSLSSRISVFS
ncbi:conserved Plasmodium protein, unknown function [Plasmodium gallinaceum]|uniref:Uncharacterized protein n=1 Tax=Plasmodium gallinaceum TaxID=5849 RepID=A0A1J1GUZ1_PLAGA|nr:conserved Plasmodium protein, unknown function [Plasmodium gallinaceum]CRG96369.1 conserved Plasmodium protein, unknown function [Plasmodium gallinaceum]